VCRTASLVKVCFQIEETQLRGGSIPVQATNLVSAVGSQTQKPVNLRLGLPDVYAGNRASDDQSLDFASPLEDRVVPIGATRSTGRDTFRREMDPQINGKTSFRPDLVRSRSPFMALARAPLRVAVCITSE
jgi:hypothetical protein